jgi:hypothetical protein
MRRTCWLAAFAAALLGLSATTATAQMFPGGRYNRGYYDGYNDDGVAAVYALNSADSNARTTSQAYQSWSQRGSQEMTGMQSGIRGAMDASADQRTQAIYDRQQGNRDWWFQVQQQQVAQQQMAQRQAPRYTGAAAGFEPSPTPHAPQATDDIIKWLPLLQAPQFAADRAKIEAPYRRSTKGLSRPTTDDYKNMIKTAERMKVTLKGMATNLTAQEYIDAESFLDKLADEARERVEKATPKK